MIMFTISSVSRSYLTVMHIGNTGRVPNFCTLPFYTSRGFFPLIMIMRRSLQTMLYRFLRSTAVFASSKSHQLFSLTLRHLSTIFGWSMLNLVSNLIIFLPKLFRSSTVHVTSPGPYRRVKTIQVLIDSILFCLLHFFLRFSRSLRNYSTLNFTVIFPPSIYALKVCKLLSPSLLSAP